MSELATVPVDADPAEPERDPDPADSVTIAYVYDQDVTYSWHHSLVELLGHDMANRRRVMRGGFVAMHYGTDGLVQARNLGVKTFLEEKAGVADWLLWLDTDMGFAPDTVDQLMAVADPVERPVVGALCFAQRETGPDGLGGWLVQPSPTIFDWTTYDDHAGYVARQEYSRDTVTQIAGTGSACILIHRSVFERVQERFGMVWYSRIPNPSVGEWTSEDLSFCMRLQECKIPVFLHTGVKTSHKKTIYVDERVYDRLPPPPMPIPDGVVRWPLDGLQRASAPPEPPGDIHTFQETGEQARQRLGIDGTAGDAQDIRHQFIPAPGELGCLACGLADGYPPHVDRKKSARSGASLDRSRQPVAEVHGGDTEAVAADA